MTPETKRIRKPFANAQEPCFSRSAQKIKLSLEEFFLLRDFIYERSGIFLRMEKQDSLEEKIKIRLLTGNYRSYEEYYRFLKYGDKDEEEFKKFIDLVAVHETSFFRNPPQLAVLKQMVLPEIVAKKLRKKEKSLRIWSAGCATGEEPYTLAIILAESIPFFRQWDIQILANDISESALKAARKGSYAKKQFRSSAAEGYIGKFFAINGSYHIKDYLKGFIEFRYLNLMDEKRMKEVKDMDIIFCRNVFIYFGPTARNKVARNFYHSLNKGGYLFTGAAETMDTAVVPFKTVFMGRITVYKKG